MPKLIFISSLIFQEDFKSTGLNWLDSSVKLMISFTSHNRSLPSSYPSKRGRMLHQCLTSPPHFAVEYRYTGSGKNVIWPVKTSVELFRNGWQSFHDSCWNLNKQASFFLLIKGWWLPTILAINQACLTLSLYPLSLFQSIRSNPRPDITTNKGLSFLLDQSQSRSLSRDSCLPIRLEYEITRSKQREVCKALLSFSITLIGSLLYLIVDS